MIVVSDTSPLSGLLILGELDLLPQLYHEVIVPHAVMNELTELENFGRSIEALKNATWLKIVSAEDLDWVADLQHDLDLGEAEAIVLAHQLKADWLLMDETKGRGIAKSQGLQTIGLIGVFLQAKAQNLIPNIQPYLDRVIHEAKFYVSPAFYERVLVLANEA